MKKLRGFSQNDPRWRNLARYHAKSADALQELDEHITAHILGNLDNVDYQLIFDTYGRFTAGLIELLQKGLGEGSKKGYTLYDSGCWDCCIAEIVDQLDGLFYEYGSYRGLDPTPPNFIRALRSWQILSAIGFSYDIVIDPVSVVTQSRIQMVLHEDYGADGISVKKASVLMHALDCKQPTGIAVCVLGHSSLGDKNDTHWVVVFRDDTEEGLMMIDPSLLAPARFNYRKIYEVCVYSRYDDIPDLFKVKQDAGLYVIDTWPVSSITSIKNALFHSMGVRHASTL